MRLAGGATVSCYVDGCLITETGFTIIEPFFTGRREELEWIERERGGDVGVRGRLWVRTTASNVNFTYVGWLEDEIGFTADPGEDNFLAGMAGLGHSPASTPDAIVIKDGGNSTEHEETIAWAFDTDLVTWPGNGASGSGFWNIPTHWTFNGGPYGDQVVPMRAAIEFKLDLGFPTVSKYGVVFP